PLRTLGFVYGERVAKIEFRALAPLRPRQRIFLPAEKFPAHGDRGALAPSARIFGRQAQLHILGRRLTDACDRPDAADEQSLDSVAAQADETLAGFWRVAFISTQMAQTRVVISACEVSPDKNLVRFQCRVGVDVGAGYDEAFAVASKLQASAFAHVHRQAD